MRATRAIGRYLDLFASLLSIDIIRWCAKFHEPHHLSEYEYVCMNCKGVPWPCAEFERLCKSVTELEAKVRR